MASRRIPAPASRDSSWPTSVWHRAIPAARSSTRTDDWSASTAWSSAGSAWQFQQWSHENSSCVRCRAAPRDGRSPMTRVAVVAESEEVRAAIAAALRASSAFDVVDVSASTRDVSAAAEMVITARERRQSTQTAAPEGRDIATAPVLTQREQQILELLADGLGNKQIAARLGITTNTVKTHLELLFDKLHVSSRAEAVATAARTGLLLL